jgi:hypothetical protein
MKKIILLTTALLSFLTASFGQTAALDTENELTLLNKRISNLETIITDQTRRLEQAENNGQQTVRTQYENAISALRIGLEAGSEIEQLGPATLRLLAVKDLSETLSSINNPTSTSVGTSFADLVTEAAATHLLLPKFKDEAVKQAVGSKFKSVLKAIYEGPIVQSLINSNPISSTINAAIQQAGFFESDNRQGHVRVTRAQLNNVSRANPNIDLNFPTGNVDGAPFNETDMKNFNSEIAKRVEFYSRMDKLATEQKRITEDLYIDAKLLYKSAKASKSEICKLLDIPTEDTFNAFETKFAAGNLTPSRMTSLLNDRNFKKALSLSDYGKEQLPDVKDLNRLVIEKLIASIDSYINVLNEYKGVADAKLTPLAVEAQIEKLKGIKNTLKKPLSS